MGPAPTEGLAQMPTELPFKPFIYSKRIKLPLKREVNNEASFTSLKSYYEINIIACCMEYIYFFIFREGHYTK